MKTQYKTGTTVVVGAITISALLASLSYLL
jgi:hypothetical protein